MTLVERLRRDATRQPNKIEQAACLSTEAADTIERQAALIERLKAYVEHDSSCPVSYAATDDQCLCGLTKLKENTDG